MLKFISQEVRVVLCTAMLLASVPAAAAEATAEDRVAAGIIVRLDVSIGKKDVNGFCATMVGTEAFREYVRRSCEAGVKQGIRKPEQCTAAALALQAKAALGECSAMDSAAFEAAIASHREGRSGFVEGLTARGVDAARLLAEERAKLGR